MIYPPPPLEQSPAKRILPKRARSSEKVEGVLLTQETTAHTLNQFVGVVGAKVVHLPATNLMIPHSGRR